MPWVIGFILIFGVFILFSMLNVKITLGFIPTFLILLTIGIIHNYTEIKMYFKKDFIIKSENNTIETFKYKDKLYDKCKFIEFNKNKILKIKRGNLEKRLINNWRRLNKKISNPNYEKYKEYFEVKAEVLDSVYSIVSIRYDAQGNPIVKN